jgi:hypothetical protein
MTTPSPSVLTSRLNKLLRLAEKLAHQIKIKFLHDESSNDRIDSRRKKGEENNLVGHRQKSWFVGSLYDFGVSW